MLHLILSNEKLTTSVFCIVASDLWMWFFFFAILLDITFGNSRGYIENWVILFLRMFSELFPLFVSYSILTRSYDFKVFL